MRKFKTFITLTAVALIAISCSTPCPPAPEVETIDMEAVKAEIMAMEEAYETAINNEDIEGMLAYYADDAISMAPNRPALVGKDAIRARLVENQQKDAEEEEEDEMEGTLNLETGSIRAEGNLVVEVGTWTYTEGEFVGTGKFVTVFEKRDGKYLAVSDIWNADKKYGDDDDDEEGDDD